MADTVELLNAIPDVGHPVSMMIYINQYHGRSALGDVLLEVVTDTFGDLVLKHPIRYSMEAQYAKADGIPLSCYRKTAVGEDVAYVVDELLSKITEG